MQTNSALVYAIKCSGVKFNPNAVNAQVNYLQQVQMY